MSQPENYRDVRAFSQSSLKLLDFSPQKFYWDEYRWVIGETDERVQREPSDAMNLGSIVDILITRPEDLEKEFTAIVGTPSGQLKSFVEEYLKLETLSPEQGSIAIATQAYINIGIKQSKLETMIARFQTEGLQYYNFLRNNTDKTIVSEETLSKAKALVKEMQEDEFMGEIVCQETDSYTSINVDITVHNQLPIYWYVNNIRYKALLDKVIIDHLKKEIRPYDIKTCGDYHFPESYARYRYDLQGAFYTAALRFWKFENGWDGYTIMPFTFLVCFTNDRGVKPQIWKMTEHDLRVGKEGYGKIKGYQHLISDLHWHIDNNKWKYHREVYEHEGIRELNYYSDEPSRS